jgi:hypothetical protein
MICVSRNYRWFLLCNIINFLLILFLLGSNCWKLCFPELVSTFQGRIHKILSLNPILSKLNVVRSLTRIILTSTFVSRLLVWGFLINNFFIYFSVNHSAKCLLRFNSTIVFTCSFVNLSLGLQMNVDIRYRDWTEVAVRNLRYGV